MIKNNVIGYRIKNLEERIFSRDIVKFKNVLIFEENFHVISFSLVLLLK